MLSCILLLIYGLSIGANIVVQWIKLPLVTADILNASSYLSPGSLLPVWLLVNVLVKTIEDGPRTWFHVTNMQYLDDMLVFYLWSAPTVSLRSEQYLLGNEQAVGRSYSLPDFFSLWLSNK